MKVCVIGNGGREHALAWRLSISPSITKVYAIPGSAAMSDCAELVGIDWQQSDHLISFLKENQVDLVVVGPEAPLVAGLADVLNKAGIPVFGPSKAAAQLEGSKVFAKDLMKNTTFQLLRMVYFIRQMKRKLLLLKQELLLLLKLTAWRQGRVLQQL